MKTATVSEIKYIAQQAESFISELAIEMNLNDILTEEFERGLASDINNGF